MADVWSLVLFRATFDGLPIDVLHSRDTFRRAVVRHEYPRRDGAIVDDEGALARECEFLVVFFDPRKPHPSDPPFWSSLNHVQRCEAFIKAGQAGKARELVHPLFGSFPAMCELGEVTGQGDQRDQLSVIARFVEQGLEPRSLNAQSAKQLDGGSAAVDVEATLATRAAAAALPADDAATVATTSSNASAEVASWDADPDIDPSDITAGLQRTSNEIERTIADLELATTPAGYPTYKALQRLHYQVRRAATRARRDAPALIQITTASPAPLRILLADVYGANAVDARMSEAMRLNRIPDPMLVDAGTALTLPTPARVGSQGTRRVGPAYDRH